MTRDILNKIHNKDLKELLIRVRGQGGVISFRTNNHIKVVMPNNKVVFMSRTPSDIRALPRIVKDFKSIGYDIKKER